jgi:hypothetical protein
MTTNCNLVYSYNKQRYAVSRVSILWDHFVILKVFTLAFLVTGKFTVEIKTTVLEKRVFYCQSVLKLISRGANLFFCYIIHPKDPAKLKIRLVFNDLLHWRIYKWRMTRECQIRFWLWTCFELDRPALNTSGYIWRKVEHNKTGNVRVT